LTFEVNVEFQGEVLILIE